LSSLCGVMLDAVMWWVLIQRLVDIWTVWYTSWNLKFCNTNQIIIISCLRLPSTFPYLSLINPLYTLLYYFFYKIHFNLIFPSMPRFSNWSLSSGFLTKTCVPGISVHRQGFRITLLLAVWRKTSIVASTWQTLQDSNPLFSEYMTRSLPIHVLHQSLLYIFKIVKIMHYDYDALSELTFCTVTQCALLA